MTVKPVFSFSEEVYLKSDPDQFMRIVTGLLVRKGFMLYELTCGTEVTYHNDFEISKKSKINLN